MFRFQAGWLLLVTGVASIGVARAQSVSDPGLVVELVTGGITLPTTMAFIGSDDILVLQKNDGRVRRILGGVLQPGEVLDVAVDHFSERGLLGIALDADFPVNHRVYLYYTESSTGADSNNESPPLGNRVYRYTWNGSALVSPALLLDLPVTLGPNHDGGVLATGPDGALYGIVGDLLRNGKAQNNPLGADPDGTGMIFRVDGSGSALPGNPFAGPATPPALFDRYFAYGVRNSFGLAFDPRTGSLWDTENGFNDYDELNRVVPGMNSGWIPIQGPDARDPQGVGDLWMAPGATYRDPEFSWLEPIAPTALVFPATPLMGCGLQEDLLVGDANCGQIYRFKLNAARDHLVFSTMPLLDGVADNAPAACSDEMGEILFGINFGAITDLEMGPDGRLYLVSLGQDAVWRIGRRPGAIADADADGVGDACDCAVVDAGSFAPPAAIPRLRVAGPASQTISWDSQAALAGAGTTARLVSGGLQQLRSDGGFASGCTLAQGVTATDFTDARPDPPVGTGRYYLARPENACGAGTFGDSDLSPDPRDPLDASPPAACP
jgi:glucose/arabinose dehydrogenase